MIGLDIARRLRAFATGAPLPRGETLHTYVAPDDDVLIVAFLRMGGESRPWAIAYGTPNAEPTVLTVPEGRNRDLVADMCAEFAPVLLDHLRTPGYTASDPTQWEDLDPLRQIWVPNSTHLDMLHHLAYAYTFTRWGAGARGRLNAFGRACGWLFRESTRPGQQHVITATEALRAAYTFPAQDLRQGHLGFLLAWLTTEGDRDARLSAALTAEELALSTTLDPEVERRQAERHVSAWGEARRAENELAMASSAAALREIQLPEILRRWHLAEAAITALRADPRRPNVGVAVLAREGLKEQWYQHTRHELGLPDVNDGAAFFPSPETDRYPAAAASRYQVHQASEDLEASLLLHDDRELIAEAIARGDAFTGTIANVEDRNPGRAIEPVWTIETDYEGVLRLTEGSWVCMIGTPNRSGEILSIEEQPDGSRIFEVLITGWKTIPKSAPPGLLRADDPALTGSPVGMVKYSADQINRRKSQRVWRVDVAGAWITHATPKGPRAHLDAETAEDLASIEPIRSGG